MPHGSRIRPKQIAEAFEDRSLLRTGVHGVPLKGWSVEVVVTRRSQRLDGHSDEEDFSAY